MFWHGFHLQCGSAEIKILPVVIQCRERMALRGIVLQEVQNILRNVTKKEELLVKNRHFWTVKPLLVNWKNSLKIHEFCDGDQNDTILISI